MCRGGREQRTQGSKRVGGSLVIHYHKDWEGEQANPNCMAHHLVTISHKPESHALYKTPTHTPHAYKTLPTCSKPVVCPGCCCASTPPGHTRSHYQGQHCHSVHAPCTADPHAGGSAWGELVGCVICGHIMWERAQRVRGHIE